MKLTSVSSIRRGLVLAGLGACSLAAQAQAPRDVHVALSFFASADHGGYYAALAEGIYEKHGLNVKITQVGPQGNNMQLVVSGKAEFANGWSMRALNAVKENIPLVSVAALFQRDPQCLIHHKGAYTSLEQLKGQPIRVSQLARGSWWPWLKVKYGFDDSQLRPYDLSYAVLLQDPKMAQQGFITNDGFQFIRQNLQMECMPLASYGWTSYSYTIDTTQQMIKSNPKLVADFLKATIEGWKAFFKDPAPASKLIKANNPQMTDEHIAYAIGQLHKQGLLESMDASNGRIGNMTDIRWQTFYQEMVAAGALPAGMDVRKAYDTQFIRQLYPAN
jgi:NitT/TauT family transport system substrate-binding protein